MAEILAKLPSPIATRLTRGINFVRNLIWGPGKFTYRLQLVLPVKTQHALGLYRWPTKSYAVWMMLQNVLYLLEPRTIVELGAGRSSSYLAEYAFKKKAQYLSFEQHYSYYRTLRKGLRASFLPNTYIVHAPLVQDWYDVEIVRRALEPMAAIDFLFYDGPATPSDGDRGSEAFSETILPLLDEVRFILVDDVHREKEDRLADQLKERFGLVRYNFHSSSDDTLLALMFAPAADALLQEALPAYVLNRFRKT